MKFKHMLIGTILLVIVGLILIFKLWVYSNQNKAQIPVLMYHDVVYDKYYKGQADTIALSTFKKQLQYFKDNGYKTLTLDEFYCWKQNKCQLSEKSVLLTFDDGFYSFKHLVEPLLKEYDIHAVNFLIGDTIGDKTKEYNPHNYGVIGKDLIAKPSKNVEYQSHSYAMHYYVNNRQKIYSMNEEDMQKDIDNMGKIMKPQYLSYPYNTDTDTFIKVLKKNNYRLAFRGESEKATRSCNDYQIPRIGVNNDFENFKDIFETKKHNNRYGNGMMRKIIVTFERKIGELV